MGRTAIHFCLTDFSLVSHSRTFTPETEFLARRVAHMRHEERLDPLHPLVCLGVEVAALDAVVHLGRVNKS